jgi:hypothetical protein
MNNKSDVVISEIKLEHDKKLLHVLKTRQDIDLLQNVVSKNRFQFGSKESYEASNYINTVAPTSFSIISQVFMN